MPRYRPRTPQRGPKLPAGASTPHTLRDGRDSLRKHVTPPWWFAERAKLGALLRACALDSHVFSRVSNFASAQKCVSLSHKRKTFFRSGCRPGVAWPLWSGNRRLPQCAAKSLSNVVAILRGSPAPPLPNENVLVDPEPGLFYDALFVIELCANPTGRTAVVGSNRAVSPISNR
jgi:hypothetical protein